MSSATESKLFQVSGLWCSSCARALQHAMGRVAGVEKASVDFVTHTVELRAQEVASLQAACSVAEGMGYRIEPFRDVASLREELAGRTRGELLRLAWVSFFAVWTMALALVEYTEVMGPLDEQAFRWLAIAMGALSVTGIFGGAYKVYLIGLTGLLRGRPSIDSLLVVASISCLALSFYNLSVGVRAVYFDSAIFAIAVVLAIRAVLAQLSRQQLEIIYRSLEKPEAEVCVLEEGEEVWKPVNAVKPGYRVRIASGSEISVDGRVVDGRGEAQSALLTGEAQPVALQVGSRVLAGEVLLSGQVEVEVSAFYGEREIDRLTTEMLSSFHQSESEGRVDRLLAFAAPALLLLAVGSLGAQWLWGVPFAQALPAALSVVLVGCPCALFFCRPLPLIRAQTEARRQGLILLRPRSLERLPSVRAIAFDKSGTLTEQAPEIELTHNDSGLSEAEVWQLLAGAELNVQHPVAFAILKRAAQLELEASAVTARCVEGRGVRFEYAGARWSIGAAEEQASADLVLRREGESVARFRILEQASGEAGSLAEKLGRKFHLSILSGDRKARVQLLASKLEMQSFSYGLNPEEKAKEVAQLRETVGPVLYCGDGYNDIAALSEADLAACLPHSPAAVRMASDVVLPRAEAKAFEVLFDLGRRARRRFRQNLAVAVLYNAIAIPSAVAGAFAPWVAAAAMAGATLLVLVNSMR